MSFGIPMIWREPKDHVTNCYFFLVCTKGYNLKNKTTLKYSNLQSAIQPIPHGIDLPFHIHSKTNKQDDEPSSYSSNEMWDKEHLDLVTTKICLCRNSHRKN